MIKKIKITNNKARLSLRDTTNGCVYPVIEVPEGTKCSDGSIAVTDGLSFKDDVGDWVDIFEDGRGYEVVEEDLPMTNNDWNTVDWDETPEDVDAVVTFKFDEPSYYKEVDGELQVQCYRSDSFECSRRREIDDVIEYFGDRFHLRPTPITKPTVEPTPVTPESTQVESSEVEATTAPEFDWSSVEDDVEAVIIEDGELFHQLKSVNGRLYHRVVRCGRKRWVMGHYSTLASIEKYLHLLGCGGCQLICRPPAITTPEVDMYDMFKGADSKPSISTILQEAQQSILKHHGVTGEVKFTVTCS